jgi:thiamine-monophosphate kinase
MYELAAAGGEDYCLLCTIDPEACEGIRQDFRKTFGRDLTAVGTITEGRALKYYDRGTQINLARHGFDHFA